MDISYDYRDLFKVFKKHNVKYLIIGAYAVAYYAEPRFTKDLDIWTDSTKENARRLYSALKEFGAPLKDVQAKDFANDKIIYKIGIAPIRIVILTSLPGLKFDLAWKNRKASKYSGIPINILGIKELIYSKKKTKRAQDILDIKRLVRKER